MQEKYGFVYIWYDKKHKRFYIGCRWGRENDGYICSSTWMKQAYKTRPEDFKRRIIKRIYSTKKNLLEEEYKWLSLIKKEELGKKYYNLNNHHFGHWSENPEKLHFMRERNLGRNNPNYGKPAWNKGKPITEETRKKIIEKRAKQIITEETCRKISESHKGSNNHFFGKIHTTETKEKMRQKALNRNRKGIKLPKSHCENISKGKKGIKFSEAHKEKLRIAARKRKKGL